MEPIYFERNKKYIHTRKNEKKIKMKNTLNMRRYHMIQQPGYDVQRRGHK